MGSPAAPPRPPRIAPQPVILAAWHKFQKIELDPFYLAQRTPPRCVQKQPFHGRRDYHMSRAALFVWLWAPSPSGTPISHPAFESPRSAACRRPSGSMDMYISSGSSRRDLPDGEGLGVIRRLCNFRNANNRSKRGLSAVPRQARFRSASCHTNAWTLFPWERHPAEDEAVSC